VPTGPHFDINMSDVFFEPMRIPRPDFHLGVQDLSHGAMTGRMLERIGVVVLLNFTKHA
jgi:UDP-N-acetylglucosamine 2-epimerase